MNFKIKVCNIGQRLKLRLGAKEEREEATLWICQQVLSEKPGSALCVTLAVSAMCLMEWENAHSFLFGHLRGRPQSHLKKNNLSPVLLPQRISYPMVATLKSHAYHISRAALPLSSEPVWAAASQQCFANAEAVVEAAAAAHTSTKTSRSVTAPKEPDVGIPEGPSTMRILLLVTSIQGRILTK